MAVGEPRPDRKSRPIAEVNFAGVEVVPGRRVGVTFEGASFL